MDGAKRRERLGETGWRTVLKRFEASGLSVRSFCEREDLGQASFYQWRTRLAARPSREASATKAARPTPTPAAFVDLGTLSPKGTRLELRLDLGAGVVMHLVRG